MNLKWCLCQHEGMSISGGVAPLIFKHFIRWMCVNSFTLPRTRRLGHHFTPHISQSGSRAGPEVLEKRNAIAFAWNRTTIPHSSGPWCSHYTSDTRFSWYLIR